MFNESLPLTYKPYQELVLCSNVLRNVLVPIMVNDFPVLLIGKELNIWLAAPLNQEASQWRYILEGHLSNRPDVVLNYSADAQVLEIKYRDKQLLGMRQESPNKAMVYQLDLRPIGLSIFGDEIVLDVSDYKLSHNIFDNIPVMIAVGSKGQLAPP